MLPDFVYKGAASTAVMLRFVYSRYLVTHARLSEIGMKRDVSLLGYIYCQL